MFFQYFKIAYFLNVLPIFFLLEISSGGFTPKLAKFAWGFPNLENNSQGPTQLHSFKSLWEFTAPFSSLSIQAFIQHNSLDCSNVFYFICQS
jgi:hypothetical protein